MSKILVIDDDVEKTIVGDSIKTLIGSLNAKVEFVSDGERGVEIVRTNSRDYDLIFLDVEFKRQRRQGFELLDMIRNFNIKIPVIATSGNEYGNRLMVRRKKKGIRYCQGSIDKHDWDADPEKVKRKLKKFLNNL